MMSSGDWICGCCEHMNFKKRESCQRCRYPKYGGINLEDHMASFKAMNRSEVVLAGDWYCSAMNCGAHNYASRSSCYRCGSTKTDYLGYYAVAATTVAGADQYYSYQQNDVPGWKTGDWICTRLGCGVHNYACRMECYKCKTARD